MHHTNNITAVLMPKAMTIKTKNATHQPGTAATKASEAQDKSASAGNRTRVTSMATMYSTTRPLMLLVALTCQRPSVANQIALQPLTRRSRLQFSIHKFKAAKGQPPVAEVGFDCPVLQRCRKHLKHQRFMLRIRHQGRFGRAV
jgi:hypothetical protein